MTVWIVGVADCESNSISAVCATKEIAERELFKERDKLVARYKEMDEFCKRKGNPTSDYKEMIKALSETDYENWNNYPHEKPYLYEVKVIEV